MTSMKKILLSIAVIAVFIAYSIHTRSDGSGIKVAPPATAANTTGSANTPMSNSGNTNTMHSSPPPMAAAGQYKDGAYTGPVEDAFYGYVQVRAVIQNGKIADVQFLQHPNDNPTSREINAQADPYLVQEAIQAQTARVDTITGATDTSMAFVQSLTAALSHAG